MHLTQSAESVFQTSIDGPDRELQIINPEPYTLGAAALSGLGLDPRGQAIYVAHNFVPGPAASGEPSAIIPSPLADIYLNFLSAPCLGKGEHAVTLPLQPGVEDYLRRWELIPHDSQIIEVPFTPPARLGFPATDPLALAIAANTRLESGSYVITAFTGSCVAAQAELLGSHAPQIAEAALTNNKAHFREFARTYGIRVAPGMILCGEDDVQLAVAAFQDQDRAWLKLDRGSGGDMVLRLDGKLTEETLRAGLQKLQAATDAGLYHAGWSREQIAGFWHPSSALPSSARVVIESDVGIFGTPIMNCSNCLIIKRDGSFETMGYFRQRTGPGGDYRGSESLEVGGKLLETLQEQMSCIARYCRDELRYSGIAGVDFMLVETPAGTIEPIIIEMNGRPPISATAQIIARKVEAPHWINLNIWTPEPINDVAAFEQTMNVSGKDYANGTLDSGMVVLQALRALYTLDGNGEKQLWQPSNAAKVLICGENAGQTEAVAADLEQHGIRFSE